MRSCALTLSWKMIVVSELDLTSVVVEVEIQVAASAELAE